MGIKKTMLAMVGIAEDEEDIRESYSKHCDAETNDTYFVFPEHHGSLPKRCITKEMLMKIVVTSPSGRDGCVSIVDSLKNNKPVIVDFSKAEHCEAHRCFNYLLGATYALNGSVQKITPEVYVFASEKMEISII